MMSHGDVKGWRPRSRVLGDVRRLPCKRYTFSISDLSMGVWYLWGPEESPCGCRRMTCQESLDAVSGTTSAQRWNCNHHEHPPEEETEAWKAESVLASWLRCRKRQPRLASPLQERDASSLRKSGDFGAIWLAIQGNSRLNHF